MTTKKHTTSLAAVALALAAGACSNASSPTWTSIDHTSATAALDWSTSRSASYDAQITDNGATSSVAFSIAMGGGRAQIIDSTGALGPVGAPSVLMKDTGEAVVEDDRLLVGAINLLEAMPGKSTQLAVGATWTSRYPSDAEVAAATDPSTIVYQRERAFRVTDLWNANDQVVARVEMTQRSWMAKSLDGLVSSPTPSSDGQCTYEVNVTSGIVAGARCDMGAQSICATLADDAIAHHDLCK